MPSAATHYTELRAEILASVRLIAVSKKQNISAIEQVYAVGCRDFGENYLQEALPKIKALEHLPIAWHFIGRIQSNKIKEIAQYFDAVQSVDRPEIALKLNTVCQNLDKIMPIFLQINLDREPQKAGIFPEDLPQVMQQLETCSHLDLQGLMMIPAVGNREAFAGLRMLRDQICEQFGLPLPRLSMGMSQDYALAVEEGATDVRIGEAIFGPRQ